MACFACLSACFAAGLYNFQRPGFAQARPDFPPANSTRRSSCVLSFWVSSPSQRRPEAISDIMIPANFSLAPQPVRATLLGGVERSAVRARMLACPC
ncbi:hypothetical protein Micbo1qcDRAFT_69806 [Microdochium bolleyi]|uniref:Uncharacterized protein n=1 Tax=Microdochium bolleyi TaxID=196109 RepID=A0A136J1R7_9PEZI|nr:hypothetical protein Micbo1qcDRAFT_69806 [Microdochium bolleyi]